MPTDTTWSIEVAGDLEKSDGGAKIQSDEGWFMILVEFVVHHWCFLGPDYFGKSDRKYSENLRSTIEEHRPCHFRSSMIGGVTQRFYPGSSLVYLNLKVTPLPHISFDFVSLVLHQKETD
ncbi:hypothetical protein YC2023_033545 [Brassica napus]